MNARRRNRNANTLTGGTGDVNPQFQSFSVTQSGADTTTTQQIALAIDRFRQGGNRIGAVEILSVTFDWRAPITAATACNISAALTTKNFGTTKVQFNEPTVVGYFHASQGAVATPYSFPYRMDCTDAAGHGVIAAVDSIFLQCASTSTSLTNTVDVKIEYRFKNIPLAEYIGIVTGQQ